MKKRIIISESERKSILSQHKQTIKQESDLKKQSLSEREMSKLINNVLINENSNVGNTLVSETADCSCLASCSCPDGCSCWCVNGICTCKSQDGGACSGESKYKVPVRSKYTGLKEASNDPCRTITCLDNQVCVNGQCVSNTIASKMRKTAMKEASGNPCDRMYCEPGTTCVDGKCVSNSISTKSTKTAMKEASGKGSCTSDSQCPRGQRCVGGSCDITTTKALKEGAPCKTESDCPPNQACYNGKCSVTTSAKQMKEDLDEIVYEIEFDDSEETIYEIEMNEAPGCPPGTSYCATAKQCCPPGTTCLGGCVGPNGRKVRGYDPNWDWGG
jgi:hypothetical protein